MIWYLRYEFVWLVVIGSGWSEMRSRTMRRAGGGREAAHYSRSTAS